MLIRRTNSALQPTVAIAIPRMPHQREKRTESTTFSTICVIFEKADSFSPPSDTTVLSRSALMGASAPESRMML
ncbi:MAG: hypothetical protein J6S60_06475 [Oscillospiraceae bacterium]|nr:hypothetical protein [Oscillospiraceae bacterium]